MADENFLDYTGLTYADILQQFNDKLDADPRFQNFRESAIAKTIVEIFAAATDLTNYYLERRAEESYLDTAKLKSSVILLSRQIGYVPTRPVPAKTSFKIIINGPISSSLTTSDSIVLSAGTAFDYNGTPFRLNKTYTYNFTASDIANGQNPNFSKEIEFALEVTSQNLSIVTSPASSAVDAGLVKTLDLVQGETLTKTFLGSENSQVAQIFQRYNIPDGTFSNYYGQEDVGYDVDDDTFNYDSNLTRVRVGNTEYRVDRRSLFNNKTLFNFNLTSAAENMCIIRSAIDETVELIFGDNKYATIGAKTLSDNITVTYFSTLGAEANKVGVVGDEITTNAQLISNSILLNPYLTFKFTKNITGGADFESVDSMKYNAPGIFYSLDRLVNSQDYISYLKTLTSPINVKNAVAWGEQEEGAPMKKLFNVVLYSVLGDLYKKDSVGNWTVKSISGAATLTDALLEGAETLSTNYANVLIKESVVDELKFYTSATTGYTNIIDVNDKLKQRSQATVRNIYVKPIIQDFNLPLTVYVKKLTDQNSVKIAIKNKVYEYLNENADFAKPVYKSNIIEVVESFPQVSHVDFEIEPDQTGINSFFEMYQIGNSMSATSATDLRNWTSAHSQYSLTDLAGIYVSAINSYLNISGSSVSATTVTRIASSSYNYLFSLVTLSATLLQAETLEYLSNITEKTFYNVFIKDLYNRLKTYELTTLGIAEASTSDRFTESSNFLNTVTKLHNNFSYILKYNMLKNGNVQNFSLRNEIPKFTLENINVVYV